jgi:hypothetical protein
MKWLNWGDTNCDCSEEENKVVPCRFGAKGRYLVQGGVGSLELNLCRSHLDFLRIRNPEWQVMWIGD